MENQGEIILYQPDNEVKLEVRLEEETVWLTQAQMAELFQTSKQNVSLHTNNIFKEKELSQNSVVKESLTTAADGKNYRVKYYNLDVIISVGYRVKSIRGTQFRQWANKVLKDYLLRGYSVNQRLNDLEHRMDSRFMEHEKRLDKIDGKIDFFVRTSLPPIEGIFYDGQLFDAYKFATDLIRSAKISLLLIDNYVDESVLLMLSKRNAGVKAEVPRPFPDYRRNGHLSHRSIAERPRQEDVRLLQTGNTSCEHHQLAITIQIPVPTPPFRQITSFRQICNLPE